MNETQNQIELFEFTSDEEREISQTVLSLTEVMCQFVAEGVQGLGSGQITIFDIINYIIGEDRKKSLTFAMLNVKFHNENVQISGAIAEKSRVFLQLLLQTQLNLLNVNIPLAVEYAYNKYGTLPLEKGIDIFSIPVDEGNIISFPIKNT